MAYNWKRLSASGALAVSPDLRRVRTFLSLQPGSVNGSTVIAFLRSVRRLLREPVLLVWDRLPAHVSGLVKAYLRRQCHWLEVEWLPPYAPELNPVEYIWSYLDKADLANFTPDNLAQLEAQVRRGARRIRRKDELAFAFLKHSGLYPEL
jgi:transposase